MKAYRFKCWAFNLYFECIVKADNEDHAQHLVAEGLSSGKIKLTDAGSFRRDDRFYLTYEELANEPKRVSTEEVKVRAQVGATSVTTK
jgi:hypothetical protein